MGTIKPAALLIAVLFLLPSAAAYEYFVNATYNITELPQYGQYNVTVLLAQNQSIYTSTILNNTKLNLSYPAQIDLFGENQTNATLSINWAIPFFSVAELNTSTTIIESILNVSNSYNNITFTVHFLYTVTHPPLINASPAEPYLYLSDAGRRIDINTFTAISFNRTHNIVLKALNGTTVFISCGQFITCPSNITVPNTTQDVNFNANIYIPQGQLAGTKTSYIRMTQGNITQELSVNIIINGDNLFNVIKYDVFNASCYDSAEALAKCYKQQSQYSAEVAQALIDKIREANASVIYGNNTLTNQTIKYVEVGNIDPKLLDSYNKVSDQYNNLAVDYKTLTNKHESLITEKTMLEGVVANQTAQLETEYAQRKLALEEEMAKAKAEELANSRRILYNTLFILLAAVLLTMAIGWYLYCNWVIVHFPAKFLLFLAGLITLSLILIKMFVG